MRIRLAALGSLFSLCLIAEPAAASIVGISSAASLGSSDSFGWTGSGMVPTPFNIVSNGGVDGTISSAGGFLFKQTQSSSWSGNFAPGTVVLWTTANAGPDITLSLANPTRAIGAQIQADEFGAFTAQISAYNSDGVLLGSFLENGVSTSESDGSAIFIGISDNTADISKIVFSLTDASSAPNDFALGPIEFPASAVPEPSTWAMMLLGFLGLGFVAYRRKSRWRSMPLKFHRSP